MKISEIFTLNKSQFELDFVDIDVDKDKPVFLDPYFLSTREDLWSVDADRTIKSFFQYIITLIKAGRVDQARKHFNHLHEPNETCLGVSSDRPNGRGIGEDNSNEIFERLLNSKAIESGLVEDLEDSAIFVEKVAKDKVSDMTTNIIRMHLIKYTQNQCKLWGIPLTLNAPSGFFWDPVRKIWNNVLTEVLVIDDKRILLVPKSIVSFYKAYVDQKYYQHYVLNYLQHEHLRLGTNLVRHDLRSDGSVRDYVTKKDLEEKVAPRSKEFLREFTERHPEIFQEFRSKLKISQTSLSNQELTTDDSTTIINGLIAVLKNTPVGAENASTYHKLMAGILELIFYPNLTNPILEKDTNNRMKRIDITFDNAATAGIFYRLHDVHKIPSQYIMTECKNYGSDIANPELDQLIGRFSPNKGQFGIIVCRKLQDKDRFMERCKYTKLESKGLIIPLTDEDIIGILEKIRYGIAHPEEGVISDRVRDVIFN